jgi:glycosyltransferase involved in cell wall biosynthesis
LLHVAQISFLLDPLERTVTRMLEDWWPLVDCAEMVRRAGARVSVVQACRHPEQVTHHGIDYYFVAPDSGESRIARSRSFQTLMQALRPDVLHVHGLEFPLEVLELAAMAPDTPILLQDHGSSVPPFWRRSHRRQLSVVAGVSFCALEQAQPFLQTGLIRTPTVVFEIPECSSRFIPGDRVAARASTGVHGDPAVLWVGHLNENKDPVTMLAGVSIAARQLPDLQLWCCCGKAPLHPLVCRQIEADPQLRDRVHLLARVPHERIETLMRAADLFVLGSHREVMGVSVMEALACGLPPVVTDIPSFRALTRNGEVGALWPCDDVDALSKALLSVAGLPRQETRTTVRAHFESELSFAAVGRALVAAYDRLLQGKELGSHSPQLRLRRAR